jgi:hypothetical protein
MNRRDRYEGFVSFSPKLRNIDLKTGEVSKSFPNSAKKSATGACSPKAQGHAVPERFG